MGGFQAVMLCVWHWILDCTAPSRSWQKILENKERKKKSVILVSFDVIAYHIFAYASQLSLLAFGSVSTGSIISKLVFFVFFLLVLMGSFDRMSLGTGRPIVLRDESSIRHCRVLLHHPMASVTDIRLIALVEMVAQKS